ncbi:hypothetical protein FIBSPDRAFT_938662 [Athelia psychrophila]|uniref:Uncharacterized protein n=1 Tax=Athelia psychrophila TaxID=1759441 RepID=A0A165XY30_9AGAM|nr:hypothetical protein FIBSPDRAFT_938662 [Fibularhizoctonia sp. CBS 109695]
MLAEVLLPAKHLVTLDYSPAPPSPPSMFYKYGPSPSALQTSPPKVAILAVRLTVFLPISHPHILLPRNNHCQQTAPSTARGLPYTVQIHGKVYADVAVTALESGVKLSGVDVEGLVKDLGPQIGWKTVFLIECGGPLFIHPTFYHRPRLVYAQGVQHGQLRNSATHPPCSFVERELETLLCASFPLPTRSQTENATSQCPSLLPRHQPKHPRSSAHYHPGFGLAIAGAACSHTSAAGSSYIAGTIRENPNLLWASAYLARVQWAELSNLHPHVTTKNLHPHGYDVDRLFSTSTSNCFFELIEWAVIAGMIGSWAASTFAVVAWPEEACELQGVREGVSQEQEDCDSFHSLGRWMSMCLVALDCVLVQICAA